MLFVCLWTFFSCVEDGSPVMMTCCSLDVDIEDEAADDDDTRQCL